MAEETTTPEQTVPEQTAPEQDAPEQAPPVQTAPVQAVPASPESTQKGGGLLVFLTVLLVLVGIADLVLWGLAGYYALRGF